MALVLFSLWAKDNLFKKDKEAAPKVSCIQKLHCIALKLVLYGVMEPLSHYDNIIINYFVFKYVFNLICHMLPFNLSISDENSSKVNIQDLLKKFKKFRKIEN